MKTFSACAEGMMRQNVKGAMYSILASGAVDWGTLYMLEYTDSAGVVVKCLCIPPPPPGGGLLLQFG